MAGDWIKVEIHTPDKPEIYAIAELLGIAPDDVFGKCFRVWAWFDAHTTNGKTNGASVSEMLINRIAGVNGFATAMVSVGWLVSDECGLTVAHFDRHNGETAKQRGLTAKRVAKHKDKTNDKGNAASVSDALPREEKSRVKNPHTPKGAKSNPITFKTFLENCIAAGEKPISAYKPVFDYAEKINLPAEFLEICWTEFKRRYGSGGTSEGKRYRDWRSVFRKAVESNWFKIWWLNPGSNQYELTTAGRTAERATA